jgi:flagellar biosynthesis component FlhA
MIKFKDGSGYKVATKLFFALGVITGMIALFFFPGAILLPILAIALNVAGCGIYLYSNMQSEEQEAQPQEAQPQEAQPQQAGKTVAPNDQAVSTRTSSANVERGVIDSSKEPAVALV